jgi:hypothetical protein
VAVRVPRPRRTVLQLDAGFPFLVGLDSDVLFRVRWGSIRSSLLRETCCMKKPLGRRNALVAFKVASYKLIRLIPLGRRALPRKSLKCSHFRLPTTRAMLPERCGWLKAGSLQLKERWQSHVQLSFAARWPVHCRCTIRDGLARKVITERRAEPIPKMWK